VLEEVARSGLSDRAFAKRHGLDPQRIWWWRKRLGRTSEGAVGFVEVLPKAAASSEVIEVHLTNGREVWVSTTVDPSVLARLLDAIEGRPC
jgi:hypothetical protein